MNGSLGYFPREQRLSFFRTGVGLFMGYRPLKMATPARQGDDFYEWYYNSTVYDVRNNGRFFLTGACGRKGDFAFEQRVREAGPQTHRFLMILDGEFFANKKINRDYDPVLAVTSFLQTNTVYKKFPTDIYYVNTNKDLWMTNALINKVAIATKIISTFDPNKVVYVGVTFECKETNSTSLLDDGLVPIKVHIQH